MKMNLIKELELISSNFGVSLNEARNKLKGISEYAYNLKGLLHHLYFAMASLTIKDVKNVLEIGTGLGETTAVLSGLFPDATIYTIDLPGKDIDYLNSWRSLKKKKNAMQRFKENINKKNIKFIPENSFFLPSLELPGMFEIIWIDGGHDFPAVAWDIMFAYSHLQHGGFMFMHDYSIEPMQYTRVKNVLEYISTRIKEKILILPSVGNDNAKTACIKKGEVNIL